ncbi:MAG: hypothetical protein GY816_08075 [Cytophagales bacterium]|nr:hypothetical protein [Cytophagales bacterium]
MNIVFHAHSGLRWLILLLIVFLILKSLIGWFSGGIYSKFDKILGSATVGLLDLQLILGFLLYFLHSAFTKNLTFNMSNTSERFWSVEHLILMILAISAAHIGKVKAKKSEINRTKFKFQAIFFFISLILMIMGIPWNRIGA